MNHCLFLTKDLLFHSRVQNAAQTHGVKVSVVAESDPLIQAASTQAIDIVLLDLTAPALDLADIVRRLRKLDVPPGEVVAFGPHVQEAQLAAARDAGCDQVLTRGEFNQRMVEILTRHSLPP